MQNKNAAVKLMAGLHEIQMETIHSQKLKFFSNYLAKCWGKTYFSFYLKLPIKCSLCNVGVIRKSVRDHLKLMFCLSKYVIHLVTLCFRERHKIIYVLFCILHLFKNHVNYKKHAKTYKWVIKWCLLFWKPKLFCK